MLLNDMILSNTQVVSDFKEKEEHAQRNSEQMNLDTNFSRAVNDVKLTILQLQYAREESDFVESDDVRSKVKNLIETCRETCENKRIKASDTARINDIHRSVKNGLKDEWRVYHSSKTNSIRELLGIARTVAGSDASSLIETINEASDWNYKREKVANMTAAIEKSKKLIDKLDLNSTIVSFMEKMIGHKATLNDVSGEVLKWIEKEGLKNRIKLTF